MEVTKFNQFVQEASSICLCIVNNIIIHQLTFHHLASDSSWTNMLAKPRFPINFMWRERKSVNNFPNKAANCARRKINIEMMWQCMKQGSWLIKPWQNWHLRRMRLHSVYSSASKNDNNWKCSNIYPIENEVRLQKVSCLRSHQMKKNEDNFSMHGKKGTIRHERYWTV